jgi:hypothetical protein
MRRCCKGTFTEWVLHSPDDPDYKEYACSQCLAEVANDMTGFGNPVTLTPVPYPATVTPHPSVSTEYDRLDPDEPLPDWS